MRTFSSTHQLSLVCIVALALGGSACGEDKQEGADTAGTAGTAETGNNTADDPEAGSASMTGDGDGEPGDGDGEPGDGDVESVSHSCLDEPGVLRYDEATGLAWVIEGGSEMDLDIGSPGSGPMNVDAAGDWLAVAHASGNTGIVHVFARHSGKHVWSREFVADIDIEWRNLYLAADGQTVTGSCASVYGSNPVGSFDFVLSAGNAVIQERSILGPAVLGWVPAIVGIYDDLYPNGFHTLDAGWLSLDGQTWNSATPAPLEEDAALVLAADGHTLEYLASVDGQMSYVRARVGESETTALDLDWYAGSFIMGRAEDQLFVTANPFWPDSPPDCPPASFYRIDLETDAASYVDPAPPPGWSLCGYGRVGSQGAVYFILTNDAGGQVWAYDIDLDAWEPIGKPFGYGGWMEGSGDLVHVVQLYDSPFDSVGHSFLTRKDPPLWLRFEGGLPLLLIDRQERCVAYRSEDDSGWNVLGLDGSSEMAYFQDENPPSWWMWTWLD
jgi:hypothetical protein